MEDSGPTEVEVELYEEIVDLNFSTPMSSRALSPFCYQEDMSTVTTFQGPILSSSEREEVSVSTGLVASVPWPALRSQYSLAGKVKNHGHLGARTEIARQFHFFAFSIYAVSHSLCFLMRSFVHSFIHSLAIK